MSSFASIRPRVSDWRGWLPLAALPIAMFVALLALGGDRGYFYRDGNTHNWNTAKTLAIAENLSPEHGFRLARHVWLNEDGGLEYDLYGRFPIGGFALLKPVILPFGDDLAAKLLAARVLMLIMFCGAALFACLAIARIAGSRRVAVAATLFAFSGFYAVYFADEVSNESVMDLFGGALVFHGMVMFVREGRFRQLVVKTCAALLLGWHVYALILPFIVLGFGGEAFAQLRAAAASGEKAKAARAAIISLARSRYAALAAVSILFGSALLAINFASEYTAYGGERQLSELPAFEAIMRRMGQAENYDGSPDLEWGNFISRQFYRAGVAFAPYAVVRAVGYDFRTPELVGVPLAPTVLGAAAALAALAALGLGLARGYRIPLASAVLFGFCWAILARHNAYAPFHNYEAVHYIWAALALFALALIGARRLLAGARIGGGMALAASALAASLFALSVFHAGQRERDASEAEWDKAIMADFSAIREITRGKRVISFHHHPLGYTRKHYYLAGSRREYVYHAGACGPGVEDFAISRYRDESANLRTPENRVAFLYENAAPLELCRAERRRLESSEPAARAEFDVYLEDDRLSYLKAPCEPRDYEERFYAYAYPVDPSELPARDGRNGYVRLMRWHTWFMGQVAAFDGACLLTVYLPDYPLSAIQTGQWIPGVERLWEVFINPPLGAEALAFYEKAWQAIESSGEPAARTGFDLYLDRDRDTLSYLKEPCGADDARGRFFLSVHPTDLEDLPEDRRELGHESLNFTFAQPAGVVFDGKCMATRQLPNYEIARIETGQWIPGGDRLWDAEIVVGD